MVKIGKSAVEFFGGRFSADFLLWYLVRSPTLFLPTGRCALFTHLPHPGSCDASRKFPLRGLPIIFARRALAARHQFRNASLIPPVQIPVGQWSSPPGRQSRSARRLHGSLGSWPVVDLVWLSGIAYTAPHIGHIVSPELDVPPGQSAFRYRT